jgi:hypothetical protein
MVATPDPPSEKATHKVCSSQALSDHYLAATQQLSCCHAITRLNMEKTAREEAMDPWL